MFDVFVSYAHADAARVKPLAEALRARGLAVWIDEREIGDFESVTAGIRDGLGQARALLAFYSRVYVTRRPCQWELTAAYLRAAEVGDPRARVLIVNPEPSGDHIEPVELRDARWRPAPAPGDTAALQALAGAVGAAIAALDGPLGALRDQAQPVWYGWRGIGSSRFVGRLRELWRVHSLLAAADAPIITGQVATAVAQVRGLAGTGKSLLAEEYALRFGAAHPGGVFWLRAHGNDERGARLGPEEREAERHEQVRAFADALGAPADGASPDAVEGRLRAVLGTRGQPFLWVVDDLPSDLDEANRRRWLAPHPLGRTLITTRGRGLGAAGGVLELDLLDEEDAYALLVATRAPDGPDEEAAARGLARDLGCHALAVDVAGQALAALVGQETFVSFRQLVADPRQDALDLAGALGEALPNGHEKGIAATILRSVAEIDEPARDFLRLASVLAAAAIPADLVRGVFARVRGIEPRAAGLVAAAACDGAARRSLAQRSDASQGAWTVHTLVARTIAFHDGDGARRDGIRQAAIAELVTHVPPSGSPLDYRAMAPFAPYQAHARALTQTLTGQEEVKLLSWVAALDGLRGDHAASVAGHERAAEALARLLGPQHPETLHARASLAGACLEHGDYARARSLGEEVVAALRRTLGDENEATFMAALNLTSTLSRQGDLPGARRELERLLPSLANALGPDSPITIGASFNLACTLEELGDLAAARARHEEVLATRRRLLGDEHPDVLASENCLAMIMAKTGDAAGAYALQTRALEIFRRTLGDDHPATLNALVLLGLSANALGRLDEARSLYEQALVPARRVLGEDHPTTLAVMNNLADTLRRLGDATAACPLLEQVLAHQRRLLGDEHRETLATLTNLGLTQLAKRDFGPARATLEAALDAAVRTAGPRSSAATVAANGLALTLGAAGDAAASQQVATAYLAWLLDADPAQLSPEQLSVRSGIERLPS